MTIKKISSIPFLLVIVGLLFIFFMTTRSAWSNKCETFDEPLHFTAAWLQVHFDDFRCDPEDPPLWRDYALVGTSKSDLQIPTSGALWDGMLRDRKAQGQYFRQVFYRMPGNNLTPLLAGARLRMLLLAVLLGAAIAAWAWKLSGPLAAVIAAAAFCFDPNFIAHSTLVKNDVATALVFLLLMWSVWLVGQRATLIRCAAVAAALGAALTVKFSGVLAIPLLGLVLTIRALLSQPWPFLGWTIHGRFRKFFAAACLTLSSCAFAYLFMWACYRFRYGPSTDPNQNFDLNELPYLSARHAAFAAYNAFVMTPSQLQDFIAHWKRPLAFQVVYWLGDHHLVPQTWAEGFLFTYGTAPGRASFLLGQSAMNGFWFYFPVVIAVKTPLATLAAVAVAGAYCFRRKFFAARGWDIVCVALPPIFYLGVAMTSQLDLGIRHILPIYPFVFVFLGIVAAYALRNGRKIAKIVVMLLLFGLILESYLAYPNYVPFLNIAAGGWRNGPNLLGDSNVDWGQDLPALAEWQEANPQYQLFLSYFGSADPRYYGIHYVNFPLSAPGGDEVPSSTRPRVYAISGNASHDPWLSAQDAQFYEILQSWKPIAILGHSIYIYNSP
jgi:hypothetical protein